MCDDVAGSVRKTDVGESKSVAYICRWFLVTFVLCGLKYTKENWTFSIYILLGEIASEFVECTAVEAIKGSIY